MTLLDRFQSILPSSKWPAWLRKPLRFVLVGTTGTFVQTGFFLMLILSFHNPEQNSFLYYIAFIGGFILEMIPNYLCMSFYTFGALPNRKNAIGFLIARGVNLVIQLIVLPLMIHWLPTVSDAIISPIVIFLAGVINFFIQLVFFKEKAKAKTDN